MKNTVLYCFLIVFVTHGLVGQETTIEESSPQGHTNENKFKQLYDEFATPNSYRNASGAPGVDYYQQQVDYIMDIELDDVNTKLYGKQTITYSNNSPDELPFLWLQLDQNIRKKDAPALEKNGSGVSPLHTAPGFVAEYMKEPFDGGFNIEWVKAIDGNNLDYVINKTMMRIDLPEPILPGGQYSFEIKWWYNVNNHVENRARSGYEYFPEDDNRAYVIAQFFPRLCVYNDVEGWQNHQFWGNGEFALQFGDYEVNITVPADHILEATGELQNPKEVLSREELKRYRAAQESFDKPVIIVNQDEVIEKEKSTTEKKSTWKFKAVNVRDFAFATSRKFIWEGQAVQIGNNKVMAVSLYPKEGNPLWEEYSTKAVVQTLKTFSKHTFDYPYPKAVSVHARNQGMEYPMICWNYGRPDENGVYSDRIKFGMISVIIHEIGHNYFPMIVNSDERQWGWMDEGLDTFMQYVTEQEFGKTYPESIGERDNYPSRRGNPISIIPYMAGDQDFLAPIMSNPENVYQLGPNAYGKPATALNILRETVMGRELFDHAFKTYSQRWKFKHPTPEDFFRTMEDASAIDLDWFWRGWFYTTDYVDIGVQDVQKYQVSSTAGQNTLDLLESYGMTLADLPPDYSVFLVPEDEISDEEKEQLNVAPHERISSVGSYLEENALDPEALKTPLHVYEITFNKPGGLVMPLIVEYQYEDGTNEKVTYPVQVWRKNDQQVKKRVLSEKEIIGIVVDPDKETADVNSTNNLWPRQIPKTDLDVFRENSGSK